MVMTSIATLPDIYSPVRSTGVLTRTLGASPYHLYFTGEAAEALRGLAVYHR